MTSEEEKKQYLIEILKDNRSSAEANHKYSANRFDIILITISTACIFLNFQIIQYYHDVYSYYEPALNIVCIVLLFTCIVSALIIEKTGKDFYIKKLDYYHLRLLEVKAPHILDSQDKKSLKSHDHESSEKYNKKVHLFSFIVVVVFSICILLTILSIIPENYLF